MTSELVYIHAGFGADAVPYLTGWELQRRLHEQRVSGEIPDVCLLLEHQAVYTAGKRTSPLDRPVGDPGAPVIDVDRGGQITLTDEECQCVTHMTKVLHLLLGS